MRRAIVMAALLLLAAGCGQAEPAAQVSTTTTTAPPATTTVTTTTAPPATTTEPLVGGLEVTIFWEIGEELMKQGTFTATGPAVDEGMVCENGTTREVRWEQGSGNWEISHVEYTCDDGSGTFLIESRYKGIPGPGAEQAPIEETGDWIIGEGTGTGSYEQLVGEGTMEGTIEWRETDKFSPTDASETFSGMVAKSS